MALNKPIKQKLSVGLQTFTFASVRVLGVSNWTLVSAVSGRTRRSFARVAAFSVDAALPLGAHPASSLALVNVCSTRHDYTTAARNLSRLSLFYTTINFTRYSVTEVGALSVAGWAWSLLGKQT